MSCKICGKILNNDVVTVGSKGFKTLCRFSELRKDNLFSNLDVMQTVILHTSCRKKYTKDNSSGIYLPISTSEENVLPSSSYDSSSENFPFKDKCIFCAGGLSNDDIAKENQKPIEKRNKCVQITKSSTKQSIIQALQDAPTSFNEVILNRISDTDLVGAEARYHKKCYLSTKKGRQNLKRGRPESTDVASAMEIIYDYIKHNEDSQFSVMELKGLLTDYVPDDRTIIKKMINNYGNRIIISELPSQGTIISMKDSVDNILKEIWYSQKHNNEQDERLRIVKKAAEIIREDICLKTYEKDYYPSPGNFLKDAEQDVPKSLQMFLKTLAGQKAANDDVHRKLISIAHSIISLLRPRKFISCVLLALAVTLKKNYGSKALITILNKLGFCATYREANTFEESAVNFCDTCPELKGFRQFVFDNADANVHTIDGKNTFHAMGGIQCVTPTPINTFVDNLPRLDKPLGADIIGTFGNVPLQHYNKEKSGLRNIIIEDVSTDEAICPSTSDILWLYGKHKDIPGIIGWNGFMQTLTAQKSFEVTNIKGLPFVNSPPSNPDTIYTVLLTAAQKTINSDQNTTLVTFDQPLYAKAREIVAEGSERNDPLLSTIVVRLGGFHLLMSFIGGIGYIMAGSGLKELWETIYAPNSVIHMLGGHAYSRALRAHFLTYLALASYVFKEIQLSEHEITELEYLLYGISDELTADNLENKDILKTVNGKFKNAMLKIQNQNPTAHLWIQYMEMVCLIRKFIEAERSGNWLQHLNTIKKMLPIFVASGHFNYAKSARLYVQDMEKLEQRMTLEEYNQFSSGAFTIRRNYKFWSGTWTDMVIEQSLMRTMKSSGGLTHGRGMTDSVLAKWILSMPLVQEVENSLETFCDLDSTIETIHKDSTTARIKRDDLDLSKIAEWFENHPPFRTETEKCVMSLSTGLVGDTNQINCHKAFEIGKNVLAKKSGIPFSELTYSKNDKVVPLSAINAMVKNSDHKEICIDPLTIFQRISFLKKTPNEMKDYLQFELAPFPMSLFDGCEMRKSKKSVLYELYNPVNESLLSEHIHYVVDGGYLLHRVPWKKGQTFEDIFLAIFDYVKRHYGTEVTVVFDGYDDNTLTNCTKTWERMRRANFKNTADVIVMPNVPLTSSQEDFLKNNKNKSRFINLIGQYFETQNIEIIKCEADADVQIVNAALQRASTDKSIVIIGNDIDILLLLSTLAQDDHRNVYLRKPAQGKQDSKLYNSESFKNIDLKDHILTLHAFGGCDTTSAIFNLGKKKIYDITKKSNELKTVLQVFRDRNSSKDTIKKAGEKVFLCLYGNDLNDDLDDARYQKFARTIVKSKINLATLPPTKSAAHQHALRVYHQVQTWLGNSLDPRDYGWEVENNVLRPIMTTNKAAPEVILKMIYCRCKTSCGLQCGCRKSGLNCTDICENCKGQSCSNSVLLLNVQDELEEFETEDLLTTNTESHNKRPRTE